MKKKFKDTMIGKIVNPILRETLQSLPVVGTIVTNFKTNTAENPTGKIKLTKWDGYRILLGCLIALALAKGFLTPEQITFILSFLGL